MSKHRGMVRVFARGKTLIGVFAALLMFVTRASAEEKEPVALVQLGAAGEWGLPMPALASVQQGPSNLRPSKIGWKSKRCYVPI
jgi:hypothetical protein